jgi:glycosyltransferase involved in cell wall biosynthesis
MNGQYLAQQKRCPVTNFIVRRTLNYIRIWDRVAADRPDYIISNSRYTQERVKKYYGRESVVIYPPVKISPSPVARTRHPLPEGEEDNYFLVVSRLSPYKKIDAVVEAFNKLELPLVIAGEGSQEKYLKKIAEKNIKFLGWQSDEKMAEIYKNARAFIFSSVDDFGIAPVEAMSYGVPVIAIRQGGAVETMTPGKTGEFFDAATPEVIADAVRRFRENENNYDREFIMSRANDFSKEKFISNLNEYIDKVISR